MKLYRHRRTFQIVSAVVFFGLLTLTVWPLGSVFLGAFLVADPLFAINSAVGGVLRPEMLIAVAMLVAPLLLGRAFCGYVCPLGFLTELIGPRSGGARSGGARGAGGEARAPARRSPAWLAKTPVFVLIASLGLLAFGSAVYLVFDPMSLITRSAVALAYPLVDRTIRLVGDVAYLAPPARPAVDVVTTALSGRLVFTKPLAFQLSFGIFAMLATLLGLSWVERRLWCRHLCPLGALLGTVGRAARLGRVVDAAACTRCGSCLDACPMAAIGDDPTTTDVTRCQLGFECADACPESAIRFGARPAKDTYSPSRRTLIAAAGLGLAGGFFTFTSLGRRKRHPRLIRPPGSVSRETAFLGLCSRCSQCMKVCPTNVIQPAVFKSGLEGVFTPEMDFEHAYCDWSCNECGKVCPTGAIEPLALRKKRLSVIGRAYIDKTRCIPWADFKDCIVCQELCPVPDKAVVFGIETAMDPLGRLVRLKRPHVIEERCIGCGICEFHCPVADEAAIIVKAPAASQ